MSKRLNKDERAAILKNIMAHRFTPQMEALARAQTEHARVIYDKLFPPEVQKLIGELPDYWHNKVSGIRVYDTKGMALYIDLEVQLHFCDSAAGFTVSSPLVGARLPAPAYCPDLVVDEQDAEAYRVLTDQWNALAALMRTTASTADAVLRKAPSVNRLIAQWPEIEPSIPLSVRTPAAPSAIVTGDLNKLLGLPVSEAKEP